MNPSLMITILCLTGTILQHSNALIPFDEFFPLSGILQVAMSNKKQHFDNLKARIDQLFREHPKLVTEIRDYFYDDMITYCLKRSLALSFSETDRDKTEILINRFFIEHEATVKFLVSYFFDYIKPFYVEHGFFLLILNRDIINSILHYVVLEKITSKLKNEAAKALTPLMYTEVIRKNNELLQSNILNENQNVGNLKARIDQLFREHPKLVTEIRDYFYDDMITYCLKRSLALSFSETDRDKTEILINRFFIEHEETVKFLISYFSDCIKPFYIERGLLLSILNLPVISSILNWVASETATSKLKNEAAKILTALMYPGEILTNESKNPSTKKSDL